MNQIVEIGLPLALVFIMFSLGLELSGADFKRVFVRPRGFIVGALGQVVLLPMVAFLIVSALPLAPETAVGVMIIAAVPGGVSSNLLTRFAGGDTALSISLTALISLVSMVTVPAIVFFALDHFGGVVTPRLSITSTALVMFAIVAVPVATGILVRKRARKFAEGFQGPARNVSGVLLVFVVATAFISKSDNWARYFAEAGVATITLNLSMMGLAFGGAALAGLGRAQRITVSMECGLQNVTMAVALVLLLGLPGPYAVPAAAYGMIMLVTAIVFTTLMARLGVSAARAAKAS